jgi:hypothetical protein
MFSPSHQMLWDLESLKGLVLNNHPSGLQLGFLGRIGLLAPLQWSTMIRRQMRVPNLLTNVKFILGKSMKSSRREDVCLSIMSTPDVRRVSVKSIRLRQTKEKG